MTTQQLRTVQGQPVPTWIIAVYTRQTDPRTLAIGDVIMAPDVTLIGATVGERVIVTNITRNGWVTLVTQEWDTDTRDWRAVRTAKARTGELARTRTAVQDGPWLTPGWHFTPEFILGAPMARVWSVQDVTDGKQDASDRAALRDDVERVGGYVEWRQGPWHRIIATPDNAAQVAENMTLMSECGATVTEGDRFGVCEQHPRTPYYPYVDTCDMCEASTKIETSTETAAPAASADRPVKPAKERAMPKTSAAVETPAKIDAVERELSKALDAVQKRRFSTARSHIDAAEHMAPSGYRAGVGNLTFGQIRAQVTRAQDAHNAMEDTRNGKTPATTGPKAEETTVSETTVTPVPTVTPAPAAKRGTLITHGDAGTLLTGTPYPLRFKVSALLNPKRGGLGWTFDREVIAKGAWVLDGSAGHAVDMPRIRAAVAALATLDVETTVDVAGYAADGDVNVTPVQVTGQAPAAPKAKRAPKAEVPSVDTIRADVQAKATEAAAMIKAGVDAMSLVIDGLTDAQRKGLAAAYQRALTQLTGVVEQAPAAPKATGQAPAAPKAKAAKAAPAPKASEQAPAAPEVAVSAADAALFTLPEYSVSGEVYGASVAAIAAAIEAAGYVGVTVKRVARKGDGRRDFTVTGPVDAAAIAAAYVAGLAPASV